MPCCECCGCCACWWTGRRRHRPPDLQAGNPRNKCALQPGHSLMDWIRLGNSGKDLTGVGGRIRPVSPTELSLHNTQNNAWLAIRGRVYNITHYLPFHPGANAWRRNGCHRTV
ncbi:unnamed protein product [Leptidea sinapis]|uniref:Cytochrome b5 heme-binding domain-containing protein n=1 Tax=Leptidea sinapis TaxID=189913 RepID=A0A5E4Q4B8_9NEOP|nr:unnamed protein product [Leptidea sinapis]